MGFGENAATACTLRKEKNLLVKEWIKAELRV
jgi:hypothetical protein